jgi:uncharacterized protein (TIGR00369 family)
MKLTTTALRRLMNELPFNSHLGLKLKRRHEDGVTIECPIRPEFANIHKTLHGGVTATLIDVAGGFGTMSHYGGRPCATVELKLSYFIPIAGKKVTARSKIIRAGSTLCVLQVDVHDDKGRLAAAGMITYILLDTGRQSSKA